MEAGTSQLCVESSLLAQLRNMDVMGLGNQWAELSSPEACLPLTDISRTARYGSKKGMMENTYIYEKSRNISFKDHVPICHLKNDTTELCSW